MVAAQRVALQPHGVGVPGSILNSGYSVCGVYVHVRACVGFLRLLRCSPTSQKYDSRWIG